jgi:hypothetical protein
MKKHTSDNHSNPFRKDRAYYRFTRNLLNKQNGKCDICNDTLNKYVVDHCHVTGEIRGLLCLSCNALVAQIENMRFGKKSLALLAKIGDYLYKHSL